MIKFSHFFVKKNKEFETALMTSFLLLLNITITIDKTQYLWLDLIYAASTYMILVNIVMVIKHFYDLLMDYSCY